MGSRWYPEINFGKSSGIYWIGPYGVLVPEDEHWVIAPDGNSISRDKGTTLGLGPTISSTEYKTYYAECIDGKYYYRTTVRRNSAPISTNENTKNTNPSCNILEDLKNMLQETFNL